MKKTILTMALFAFSTVAMAQTTVCSASGTPAANVIGATDGSLFVRATFAPTCSPNTVMQYQQDTGKLWAASASVKGQTFYGASTNGGSVGSLGACNSNKTCGTASEVEGKLTTPLAAAEKLGNT